MQDEIDLIVELLPFLIPLFILQIGLMVFALIDLAKRKRVKGDNKVVWVLVIILVNIIGPILYLAIGRKEDTVDSDQD